jgi:hypothetical protein
MLNNIYIYIYIYIHQTDETLIISEKEKEKNNNNYNLPQGKQARQIHSSSEAHKLHIAQQFYLYLYVFPK